MAYQALYREWRPQTFDEVVGQPHIVRTIQNMLKQGRIYHAFLFCGPRGTGKTTLAKLLAKALNCQDGPTPTPCLTCAACRGIRAGSYMDVLEIDGASNRGIDEIRELRERVKYAPTEGRYKVYIIDEVHMLTAEAFNALLKTLEEPPAHVIFVFATTEVQKVPATILSRCQRFDFRRLSQPTIAAELANICQRSGIAADSSALRLIAQAANGGMRDALSMLDQAASYAGDQQTTALDVQEVVGLVPDLEFAGLLSAVAVGDFGDALVRLQHLVDLGKEIAPIVDGFLQYCRDCLLYVAGVQLESFAMPTVSVSSSFLTCMLDALLAVERDLRFVSNARVLLELAMFRASQDVVVKSPQPEVARTSQDDTAPSTVPSALPELAQPSGDLVDIPVPSLLEAPDATSVATPEATPLTLRLLRQRWPDFVAKLSSAEPGVGAKLASGQLQKLTANVITLGFEKSFSKKIVEQPDNLQMIQLRLLQEFQMNLRLDCVLIEEGAPEKPEVSPARDEAERIALALFEGQEVSGNMIGGQKTDE